ncbi:replication-relaxation family protein [Actinoallomurus sp. NPDC050550]|uniref:replication-relaxation family protein n=1 Tax=Actinoallomurus sp. NPDC050550 TaxID=3154937 RepID=UPI0033D4AE17
MRLATQISPQEFAILETVDILGIATGEQIERLHFTELSESSRHNLRRRALRRLSDKRALVAFPRRVGGRQRGSETTIYGLGIVGQRLMAQRQGFSGAYRPRRRSLPGLQLLAHVLAVSELYVRLVEASRVHGFSVTCETEPASWWRDSGKVIKPDAYAVLATTEYSDYWWIEVDRSTESVPTVLRQLDIYTAFAERGLPGPSGVIPRVLVTVPTEARCTALIDALSDRTASGDPLITVTVFDAAVGLLTSRLLGTETPTPASKGDQ